MFKIFQDQNFNGLNSLQNDWTKKIFNFNLENCLICNFHSVEISYLCQLLTVELEREVEWCCLIWRIYARFAKKMSDPSQLILSLILVRALCFGVSFGKFDSLLAWVWVLIPEVEMGHIFIGKQHLTCYNKAARLGVTQPKKGQVYLCFYGSLYF